MCCYVFQSSFATESDRGRYFFEERPFINKKVLPEVKQDFPSDRDRPGPSTTAQQSRGPPPPRITKAPPSTNNKPSPAQQDNAMYYGKREENNQRPPRAPRGSQADRYGPPKPTSQGGRNSKPDMHSGAIPPKIMTRPVENPITGGNEFAPIRDRGNSAGEQKAPVELPKSTTPTEAASAPGELSQDGPRVPNRARPSVQLYQPRGGKRRYQNWTDSWWRSIDWLVDWLWSVGWLPEFTFIALLLPLELRMVFVQKCVAF